MFTIIIFLVVFTGAAIGQNYWLLNSNILYKSSEFSIGKIALLKSGDIIYSFFTSNTNLYYAKFKNQEGFVEIARVKEVYDIIDTTKHFYFPSGEVFLCTNNRIVIQTNALSS